MRVLICGDRNWTDSEAIEREIRKLPPDTVIIEGEANGADKLARRIARRLGYPVEQYPAKWERYGFAAGPIRNSQMLKEGQPDLVIAFHPDLSKSKGTADMVKKATKAGVEVRVFKD